MNTIHLLYLLIIKSLQQTSIKYLLKIKSMNSSKYIYTTITLIISSICGTAIGIMNTIIVNFTLLEISTSSDFSFVNKFYL